MAITQRIRLVCGRLLTSADHLAVASYAGYRAHEYPWSCQIWPSPVSIHSNSTLSALGSVSRRCADSRCLGSPSAERVTSYDPGNVPGRTSHPHAVASQESVLHRNAIPSGALRQLYILCQFVYRPINLAPRWGSDAIRFLRHRRGCLLALQLRVALAAGHQLQRRSQRDRVLDDVCCKTTLGLRKVGYRIFSA